MKLNLEQPISNSNGGLLDLILQIKKSKDEREILRLKKAIYNQVAGRLYSWLHNAGSKRYRGIPDWEGKVLEIFQDTLQLVLGEIQSFKVKDTWTNEECYKVVMSWLAKIANNKFLKAADEFRQERVSNIKYTHSELPERQGDFHRRVKSIATYDKIKFDLFWGKLNEMSKEILFFCIEEGTIKEINSQYISQEEVNLLKFKNEVGDCAKPEELSKFIEADGVDERNKDHLSDETMDYLTSKYGVKPPAVRKAKERALNGLRNCKI
jgi:hypothetical protein